ncbi:MAG: SDR family oxidoreductase, partial [Planctomycetota bacterium]|nr:SDR family oxidoreductase [Planctomycetota bacterium]
ITGGASGIGLACAQFLQASDARVWALDRDQQALDAASDQFAGVSDPPQFVCCDVGDEAELASTIGRVDEESGGIDILISNAAVLRDQTLVSKLGGKIKQHSLADWDETIRCNLTGTFLAAREVATAMIRGKRSGLIINMSSISRAGNPGQSAYAATKGGIDALTVTWSQELAPYRIRVAAIAPGFVETPMTENIPALFLEQIREKTPLRRFGELEEFAHAVKFVIENDYFNGKTLELDGGLRF